MRASSNGRRTRRGRSCCSTTSPARTRSAGCSAGTRHASRRPGRRAMGCPATAPSSSSGGAGSCTRWSDLSRLRARRPLRPASRRNGAARLAPSPYGSLPGAMAEAVLCETAAKLALGAGQRDAMAAVLRAEGDAREADLRRAHQGERAVAELDEVGVGGAPGPPSRDARHQRSVGAVHEDVAVRPSRNGAQAGPGAGQRGRDGRGARRRRRPLTAEAGPRETARQGLAPGAGRGDAMAEAR